MRVLTHPSDVSICKDRRKYVRFNVGALQLQCRRRGLLNQLTKPESVDWLNFNQFGFAFSSAQRFEINEKIIVSIKAQTCTLKDLVAVIHNARRQGGVFRYGAQFYFGANSYMKSPDIIEALAQIEGQLE